MREGSIEIPALMIMIACGDAVTVKEDGTPALAGGEKYYLFDQVDGLTVREFFKYFNDGSDKRLVCIAGCYNGSKYFSSGRSIRCPYQVFFNMGDEVLDREISEVIEEGFYDNYDKEPSIAYLINTFCARYRGRNQEYIMKMRSSKQDKE